MIAEHRELTVKKKQLGEEIKHFEKCDPVRLEEVKKQVKTCKEASVRWTDNLFEMESWIKKSNPGVSTAELG